MDYEIRLDRAEGRPTAVVRRQASLQELSTVVPQACGTVWDFVRARDVSGAGRNVAVYLDDRIRMEVGVEMEAPFAGEDEVVASTTPAGTVATTTHYGPYGLLHEAHTAIRQWCEGRGYTLAGPNWEVYGHWQEAWNDDPGRIETDVFYLLVGSPDTDL